MSAARTLWLSSALVVLASALLNPHLQSAALAQDACPGGGYDPTPTAVTVDAVPIVVASTTADYFVLYANFDVDGTELEFPVAVVRGEAGTTTVEENVAALPKERYRVEQYLVADPADVDGDCIDDITELDNLGSMNPVNPAAAIELEHGALAIPDRETFQTMSFEAPNSDTKEYVKFVLFDFGTPRQRLYLMNTETYPGHEYFNQYLVEEYAVEGRQPEVDGTLVYAPELANRDHAEGVTFFFQLDCCAPNLFQNASRIHALLAASLPMLESPLGLRFQSYVLQDLQEELPLYWQSRIPLVFDEELYPEASSVSLNAAVGYGLLRVVEPDERPHPRDVVIYEVLPNELPRVAGIISAVPQTPLSHVNLRAAQDAIPNAYIRDGLEDPRIVSLLGRYVRYEVTSGDWNLRAATIDEVEDHYESSRPAQEQVPERDLSITAITALSEIDFDDWKAFGVKAANVAVLRTLGFPSGTVPDGFAIPFYFYDEFMKHNGFYARIEAMLADPDFQSDFDTQDEMLDELRDDIEDAATPQWIIDAIVAMNESFPEGINRRYRSSTNNEDLPGFNGAGLYDSKSQKPSEDEDDLAKSLKEVYASLWNFRAFTEREFHRIDHLEAAMGILVHPSYQDELVNGVAVSFDPVRGLDRYYVNSQVGEDLVTNPDAFSTPEEILLDRSSNNVIILAISNLAEPGELLMSNSQMRQLRRHLKTIHDHFRGLYNPAAGEPFAMEIEFKITSENILTIKQARPWVFAEEASEPTTPPVTPPVQPPVQPPVTPPVQPPVTPPVQVTGGGFGGLGGGGGPSGPTPSDEDFEWTVDRDLEELDSGHELPTGLWSDGLTLWLLDNASGAGDAVYAYDLESGERVEDREFELAETNRAPRGIWSDGATVWVSDSGQERLFAYDLATGERLEDRDSVLANRNKDARGIWSDGATLWVADGGKDSLFAYDLATGALLGEYSLHASNGDPRGIWSDGVTIWVSDHGAKRLFAYRVPAPPDEPPEEPPALERVAGEEFAEPGRVGNNSPRGIWSDGALMYVADANDGKVYSYNMPDALDARLASLTLEGVDFGEFDPRRTEYEGIAGDGVTATTVEAEGEQSGARVVIAPADADAAVEGHQVALTSVEQITVTVTSEDGSRERVYRVRIAEAGPSASCLRGAVDAGFSLVVYQGGSVDDLVACAERRHVTALYALRDGEYVPYILGAPDFVNASFADLFADGVPSLTPLVVRSEGPATPAPPAPEVTEPFATCLRGDLAEGFSLVLYEGGSVYDLEACAAGLGVTAVYVPADGEWAAHILGAPEFVNARFNALFPDAIPVATPLTVRGAGT